MAYFRWILSDPITVDEYEFYPNPNAQDGPNTERSFSVVPTTSPHGRNIVYEGPRKPTVLSLEGVLFDEESLTELQAWADKEYILQLTDDLGSKYIVINDFSTERVRAHRSPWKHTYTMVCTLVQIS